MQEKTIETIDNKTVAGGGRTGFRPMQLAFTLDVFTSCN
jgi:hypothetical protein